MMDNIEFDATFLSLDWHPSDHVSFIDNVKKRPLDPTSPVSSFSREMHLKLLFCKLFM